MDHYKGLSLILVKDYRITFLVRPLVRESNGFLSDLTYSKEIIPSLNSCFIAPCLKLIYLLLPLYTLFLAIPMGTCESQCKETGTMPPTIAHLPVKCLNHSTSCLTSLSVINSDSIVGCAIQVYFSDFYEIAPPLTINTYSLVEPTVICYPIWITISFQH